MNKSKIFLIVLLGLLALSAFAKKKQTLYDPAKTSAQFYNKGNFDKQITKNRNKLTSFVHYFKSDGK